jgi:drug/metabolite transporter (DMT)-like permease
MRSTAFFTLSMLIFGTIGALVRLLPLPPGEIALVRGLVGVSFLIPMLLATRQPLRWKTTAKYAPRILLAGIALAGNWICLFEAFKSTTIALATISYYTAPVYVLLLSPVFFRERLTTGKIACVILTFAGMALIAFGHQGPVVGQNHLLGLIFGFSAALFYAALMITNRFLRDLTGIEATVLQLVVASAVLVPYVAITGFIVPTVGTTLALLAVLGIVNTGLGFFLFFSGMKGLPASSIAVFSYLDPLTSVLVSLLLFGEKMTPGQGMGAALIFGSTLAGGVLGAREKKR